MAERKFYVLRTHSLLKKDATLQFDEDNVVVIPMAVLEDLENYEGYPEDRRIAKEMLKYVESLGIEKLSKEGVRQTNGSLLQIALDAEEVHVNINNITSMDKRCFQVCLKLKEEGKKVVLISNNSIIRMKADILGIEAEEPKFQLFPALSEQYKGKKEVYASDTVIGTFYNQKYLTVEDIYDYQNIDWLPNMFLTIKGEQCSALARFDGKNILPLIDQTLPGKFNGLNNTQKFLIDAIRRSPKEAPIVIVKGPAGTGKTFTSLVMSLLQTKGIARVKNEEEIKSLYGRTLIAAPMVEDIAKKIGAVPGGLDEKLNPYVAGIMDNVNDIFNYSKYLKIDIPQEEETKDPVRYILNEGKLKLVSLDLLRGRTFPNVCFIIDEAQNIRPSDMKTIATRIGKGSKFIFLGDPSQVDAPELNERYNGLTYLSEVFKGHPLCHQICFDRENETVRSEFAKIAAQML